MIFFRNNTVTPLKHRSAGEIKLLQESSSSSRQDGVNARSGFAEQTSRRCAERGKNERQSEEQRHMYKIRVGKLKHALKYHMLQRLVARVNKERARRKSGERAALFDPPRSRVVYDKNRHKPKSAARFIRQKQRTLGSGGSAHCRVRSAYGDPYNGYGNRQSGLFYRALLTGKAYAIYREIRAEHEKQYSVAVRHNQIPTEPPQELQQIFSAFSQANTRWATKLPA